MNFTKQQFARKSELLSFPMHKRFVFQYKGVERDVEYQEPQGRGFLAYEIERDGLPTGQLKSFTYDSIEGDVEMLSVAVG